MFGSTTGPSLQGGALTGAAVLRRGRWCWWLIMVGGVMAASVSMVSGAVEPPRGWRPSRSALVSARRALHPVGGVGCGAAEFAD